MPTTKGVSAPFFFGLHVASRRPDELLAAATRDFQSGMLGDALVACESLCRTHPGAALPAMLRARILQAARPTLAPRAWEAAWERDPLDPVLQDALIRAWLKAGSARRAADHGLAFLAQRARGGTHEPLLSLLRTCGVSLAGACWGEGSDSIEVRCFGAEASRAATVVVANGDAVQEHAVPAGGALRIRVPAGPGAWSVSFRNGPLLQGSPVAFENAPVTAARRSVERGVDVIVPAYRNLRAVQACLQSVMGSLPANRTLARIVVVNDASPETALVLWLQRLASSGQITLLHNRFNLGFIETVNRALAAGRRDALLLNADTLVNGDWIDRMCRSLAADPRVASVMPWTNNGEIGSVVPGEAPACDAAQLAHVDAVASRLHREGRLRDFDIPTCSGFAMLMRRKAIDAIGMLDGANLTRGYLEEVDWCLRARAAGWHHVLAAGVFVAHSGGASFGVEKHLRVRQNRAVIAARYPHYYGEYARFLDGDELCAPRGTLAGALSSSNPPWPAPAAQARSTPGAGPALPTAVPRIGVVTEAHEGAGAKVLALARSLASTLPAPPARLLVFGDAATDLLHTGVVDAVPSARGDTLLPDATLASLVGCDEFLEPGFDA